MSKGRSGRVVASSVPLCLQEEGQGMGQGDAACPRRGMCHLHRLCPVLLRFVKVIESVRPYPLYLVLPQNTRPCIS